MARITPIPVREKEICNRLRQARLGTGLSQVAFARQIGIDSSRLSSYEHARVPVRFGIALAASLIALKSLEWLATGLEAREIDYSLYEELQQNIAPNALFSAAYDQQIKPFLDAQWRKPRTLSSGSLKDVPLEEIDRLFTNTSGQPLTHHQALELLGRSVEDAIRSAPPPLLQELYSRVILTLKQFQRTHFTAIQAHAMNVSNVSDMGNISHPRPSQQMPKFRDRLKKATAARGQKTALANDLGAPLARISQWLSGERDPDGENTLRLLKWLERQEQWK